MIYPGPFGKGSFGLFEKGTNELFEHDLNIPLLEALGLNVPEQTELIIEPDSTGFYVYNDYLMEGINESSYMGSGMLDYYSSHKPNAGNYCIEWKVGEQYTNIGFDFVPNKDLSLLKDSMYALCFLVRGYGNNNFKFDVRFIDSKVDETDHPWRMRYTISASNGPWDGYWHKVYIPLTNFSEQGSWDNGAWYNPEGKFDWKNIDRLEIVSEHSAGNGMMLWFDQIHLTRMDTCNVVDTSQYIPPQTYVILPDTNDWALYPNPVVDFLYLKASQGSAHGRVRLSFHDIAGRNVYSCSLNVEANAPLKVPVKPMLQKGVYLLVVESNHNKSWYKVLVQ